MGVILTGHIDVPPERMDAVRAALPAHIALTRAESGCVRFEVTEDAGTPGRFRVEEAFTDAAAFHAHQSRTAPSGWARVTDGIAREYSVTGLDD